MLHRELAAEISVDALGDCERTIALRDATIREKDAEIERITLAFSDAIREMRWAGPPLQSCIYPVSPCTVWYFQAHPSLQDTL